MVPDLPGQQAERRLPVWKVFMIPGVRPVLAVIFLWMTAHNILYIFVGSRFLELSVLTERVGLILLVLGLLHLSASGLPQHWLIVTSVNSFYSASRRWLLFQWCWLRACESRSLSCWRLSCGDGHLEARQPKCRQPQMMRSAIMSMLFKRW